MWVKEYSKLYKDVKAKDIWRIWVDVNNWSTWHENLDYCKMDGSFEVGNHFYLKPKGAPEVKIILTEIDQGKSFTDCTKFFGAKMYDTHRMIETPEGLLLSHKMIVTGPLKWLWIALVARNVFNDIPEVIETLVKLARSKNVK